MGQKIYDIQKEVGYTPVKKQNSGARKLQRAPQSISAPQSKDLMAAQKANKKANAQKVAQEMQARRAAQQRTQQMKGDAQQRSSSSMRRNQNHAPLYNIEEDMPKTAAAPKRKARRKEAPPLTKKAMRRRKAIRNLIAGLFLLVLVGVGIGYSINLLFRVKTIEIQTPDGQMPADMGVYTEEIIRAKLSISLDDHFLSFRTAEQAELLQEALPLLENITVTRDYPDGVVIRLEPAVETYTMALADGWLVLSGQMHVMETTTQKPNLLVLSGATPSTYVAGQPLAFVQTLEEPWYEAQDKDVTTEQLQLLANQEMQARSDAQVEALQVLIQSLTEVDLLRDVTAITFAGEDGMSFCYQDRIVVLIGTANSLEYKLNLVQYVLWNKNGDGCAETDTGVLDVSYQSADGTITTTFAQG